MTKCLNATCLIYSSLYKKNTVQLFILVLTMKLRSVSGSVILFWEDELFCHFPSECFILYIGVYILVNLNAAVPIVHVFLEWHVVVSSHVKKVNSFPSAFVQPFTGVSMNCDIELIPTSRHANTIKGFICQIISVVFIPCSFLYPVLSYLHSSGHCKYRQRQFTLYWGLHQ